MSGLYEKATAAFNTYAGMDTPELPDDRLSAVQVRLHRWQIRNFGCQPPWTMVLGITEEVGELLSATSRGLLVDAAGDVMVFSAQLCTDSRLDFGVLLNAAQDATQGGMPSVALMRDAGALSHIALKTAQRIRGFDDPIKGRRAYAEHLCLLLSNLRQYTGLNLSPVFVDIAEHVMKRDWRNDPDGRTAT